MEYIDYMCISRNISVIYRGIYGISRNICVLCDIPQRIRDQYMNERVRMIVDAKVNLMQLQKDDLTSN